MKDKKETKKDVKKFDEPVKQEKKVDAKEAAFDEKVWEPETKETSFLQTKASKVVAGVVALSLAFGIGVSVSKGFDKGGKHQGGKKASVERKHERGNKDIDGSKSRDQHMKENTKDQTPKTDRQEKNLNTQNQK